MNQIPDYTHRFIENANILSTQHENKGGKSIIFHSLIFSLHSWMLRYAKHLLLFAALWYRLSQTNQLMEEFLLLSWCKFDSAIFMGRFCDSISNSSRNTILSTSFKQRSQTGESTCICNESLMLWFNCRCNAQSKPCRIGGALTNFRR